MGIIQRQGIQSAIITYTGIVAGCLSLLVIQPNLLSPEEIGLTRILYSFSFLVSTLLPLGIGNITTRFFPRFRDSPKQHHGFFGLMLLWVGAGLLVFLPLLWVFENYFIQLYQEKSPLFSDYFFLVFPLSIIIVLISTVSNFLSSAFKPILPAFAQEVMIRILFIGLIIIYATGWISLRQFVYGFVGTYALQLFILLIYASSINAVSLRINRAVITSGVVREMIRYGWMVFLAGISSIAIKLLDVVILGRFVPLGLVGIYGIAAFIPVFIEAPLTALEKVANARVAHAWEKNDLDNIRDIYYKSSRYLFLLGGFLFLLVTVNAPFLFRWLPAEYMAGIPVVSILSLSALFNLATGSNTTIIFSSQRFTAGAIALTGVAVLNLVLLYTLIPVLGIEGAAWSTCIASFLYNAFKYVYIWGFTRLQPFDRRTLFIVLAIAATYATTLLLPNTGNTIADIALHSLTIVTVYGLIAWYSGVADDLKEAVPFFRKKN